MIRNKPLPLAQLLEVLRADRRRRWLTGDRVPAEAYLRRHPAFRDDPLAAVELIYHEALLREELGEAVEADEYLRRFPQWTTQLERVFEVHRALAPEGLFSTPAPDDAPFSTPPGGSPAFRCRFFKPRFALVGVAR